MSQRKVPRERAFNPQSGLLGKQLASITSTLTQASKRRDYEVEKRVSQHSSRASTPAPVPPVQSPKPFVPYPSSSPPNGSVTNSLGSDPLRIEQTSISDNGRFEVRGQKDLSVNEESNLTATSPPLPPPPQVSLRGGEAFETDEPSRLLAEIGQKVETFRDMQIQIQEDDSLNKLHEKLTTMLSFPRKERNEDSIFECTHSPPRSLLEQEDDLGLQREYLPYAAALQFERAGCEWEDIRAWTEYLYNEGLNGHISQRQKEALVQQALQELDEIKEQALREEMMYCASEERASLPCRLIVTNIAADADEEELARLFQEFRFEIQNVRILDERELVKRTQVAHVDMYTRCAAKQASHTIGAIFGLMVNIRLAVEENSEQPVS